MFVSTIVLVIFVSCFVLGRVVGLYTKSFSTEVYGVRSNIIIRDDHVNLNSKSIERTFQSNPDAMILII